MFFSLLGWLIGTLDLKAAVAEGRGDLGGMILFFLPGVALIEPNGSLVELFSGSAAALVAAFGLEISMEVVGSEEVHYPRLAAGMSANHT